MWAYIRIHHWFSRTTDQGKNARRLAIMDPPQCKHDHEIPQAIEEWEERYRILKDEDKESELPESWRMTALKKILCGDIRKHIELREEEIKSYDELRKIIMNWAVNKKLEKSKHDPMDIGAVNDDEPLYQLTEMEELTKLLETYNVGIGGLEDEEGDDIDAVAKGKGRGKGTEERQEEGNGGGKGPLEGAKACQHPLKQWYRCRHDVRNVCTRNLRASRQEESQGGAEESAQPRKIKNIVAQHCALQRAFD